jgi:hypothetical protein
MWAKVWWSNESLNFVKIPLSLLNPSFWMKDLLWNDWIKDEVLATGRGHELCVRGGKNNSETWEHLSPRRSLEREGLRDTVFQNHHWAFLRRKNSDAALPNHFKHFNVTAGFAIPQQRIYYFITFFVTSLKSLWKQQRMILVPVLCKGHTNLLINTQPPHIVSISTPLAVTYSFLIRKNANQLTVQTQYRLRWLLLKTPAKSKS